MSGYWQQVSGCRRAAGDLGKRRGSDGRALKNSQDGIARPVFPDVKSLTFRTGRATAAVHVPPRLKVLCISGLRLSGTTSKGLQRTASAAFCRGSSLLQCFRIRWHNSDVGIGFGHVGCRRLRCGQGLGFIPGRRGTKKPASSGQRAAGLH